jgi:hypothetical protein
MGAGIENPPQRRKHMGIWCKTLLSVGVAMLLMGSIAIPLSQGQSIKLIDEATFKKRIGQSLVFYTREEGKVRLVKGRLVEDTKILDDIGREMDLPTADLTGVWELKVREAGGEGLPDEILEMQKTREKE